MRTDAPAIGWKPLAALLGCAAALIGLALVARQAQWADDFGRFTPAALAMGLVYALGVVLVLQSERLVLDRRLLLALILVVAVILRLVALATPPNFLSTDIYRYIWDGRVQGAGINPYLYVPADPALISLRDEAIYSHINRIDWAPTIYAPFAQLVFLAITRLGDSVLAMRLGMLGFEIMAVLALAALLKRCGVPLSRLAFYLWHPLPVWELACGGHVDAVLMAGITTALLAAVAGRRGLAGTLLALATLTKFLPLVLAPALYRRFDWRMPAAFLVAILALYASYAIWGRAGWRVLGFLPGYASEEGFANGNGAFVLSLLREIGLAPFAAKLGFAAITTAALGALALRSLAREPEARETVLLAAGLAVATIVLVSPHHPWYFCWLVAFIPFAPRLSLVYLTTSVFYMYVTDDPASLWTGCVTYGPFLALLALEQSRLFVSLRLQEGPIS